MKVKANELREQSMEELNKRLSDFEEQLFKLRFQRSTGQIEDPTKIRDARRNIARVKTVINERRAGRVSMPVDSPVVTAPAEEKSNE
jgi:large subunit ribosomal protein L29